LPLPKAPLLLAGKLHQSESSGDWSIVGLCQSNATLYRGGSPFDIEAQFLNLALCFVCSPTDLRTGRSSWTETLSRQGSIFTLATYENPRLTDGYIDKKHNNNNF